MRHVFFFSIITTLKYMTKTMNFMTKIPHISIAVLSATLLCNAAWAEDAPETPSPLLVQSSSNYNLLSVNGAEATGVINVTNVGKDPITNLTYSTTDPKTITVDTGTFKNNCFKLPSLPAGGFCQYKLHYTGQGKSATTTSVVFKLSSTEGYDLFRVNAIDMPLNTFFKPSSQATNTHNIADSPVVNLIPITKGTITELYAATLDNGVFKSTDGGENWITANSGLPTQSIEAFTSIGTTLYVGTGYGGRGMFKSTDYGINWTPCGLADQTITTITTVGNTLYVGTLNEGVYKSIDNGITWKPINQGLARLEICSLFSIGANVYVSTETGLFMLKDGDETWTYSGLRGFLVHALLSTGKTLYAGTYFDNDRQSSFIYKSTDGGNSWQPTTFASQYSVASLVSVGDTLYVGVSGEYRFSKGGGIYKSTDGGNTWQPSRDSNIKDQNVKSLLSVDNTLYAGTSLNGVFKSTNGDSWAAPQSVSLVNTDFQSSLVVGTTLYVGNNGLGIFKSMDNGANWTRINSGLGTLKVTALTFDGVALYAGTADGNGVFKSVDHGENWTYVGLKGSEMNEIYALTATDNTIYASNNFDICKSTDQGATWTCAHSYPYLISSFLSVDPNHLYAGSNYGEGCLLVSSDRGKSWTKLYTFTTGVTRLAVIGNTLYAGTFSRGVFKSTDDGLTWNDVNIGLPDLHVLSLLSVGSSLYVGLYEAFGGGLFKHTADSESWAAAGLTNNNISSILSVDQALYVATRNGIFMEYTH